MATARKLPSGSYRVRVFVGMVNDKKSYKSFTADTKVKAELLANTYIENKDKNTSRTITFDEALGKYISSRESVLSAGTIREYKRSRRAEFSLIRNTPINNITQDMIQNVINNKAKECKPKTVRNLHGIISAVLKEYRPDFTLKTSLPQKIRPNLYIPTDDEVKALLNTCKDKEMRIAILLAAFGPMRRSEICGLESSDIKNKIVHVQRAVVLNDKKEYIDKTTKSLAGDRFIPLPDFVYDEIKDIKGRIIHLKPNMISDRFIDIQKASGLPHFRFHDLRHYCASILHANGMPDAYIMQRGGWASDIVLKQIYRHALSDKSEDENDKANKYFSQMYDMKYATK